MHNLTVNMLKAYQLERPGDTDIFHKGMGILFAIYEKAMREDDYCIRYLNWLNQKTSTIALRELCADVGYDYWDDLLTINAINTIDSVRLWWYGKQQDLIKQKAEQW